MANSRDHNPSQMKLNPHGRGQFPLTHDNVYEKRWNGFSS